MNLFRLAGLPPSAQSKPNPAAPKPANSKVSPFPLRFQPNEALLVAQAKMETMGRPVPHPNVPAERSTNSLSGFRPNPALRAVQAKMALPQAVRAMPPVYSPQSAAAQTKPHGHGGCAAGKAPPVYRPQLAHLQARPTSAATLVPIPISRPGTPSYPPQAIPCQAKSPNILQRSSSVAANTRLTSNRFGNNLALAEPHLPGKLVNSPFLSSAVVQCMNSECLGKGGKGKKGKKGVRGGRPVERKVGKKHQRDRTPWPMSDPNIGEAFIEWWHDLKQSKNGRIPDWEGRKWWNKTLAEITGSMDPDDEGSDWNTKTIKEMFTGESDNWQVIHTYDSGTQVLGNMSEGDQDFDFESL